MILARPKISPQQRFDLEDLSALLAAARTDSKLWTKAHMSGVNLVLQGFGVTGIGLSSAVVNMSGAAFIVPQNNNDFSYFVSAPAEPNITIPDADLTNNARNFVELALTTEDNTPLTKAFWDPEANSGNGAEFNQIVNTVTDLKCNVVVSTAGFSGSPDRLPLCIIDTNNAGVIKVILDRRNLFGRLALPNNLDNEYAWGSKIEPVYSLTMTATSGSFIAGETITIGGETAKVVVGGNPSITFNEPTGINFNNGDTVIGGTSSATGTVDTVFESFTGVDKSLATQKQINDAIMTELKLVKGKRFWWQEAGVSLIGVSDFLNAVLVQAVTDTKFKWNGTQLFITDNALNPSAADVMAYLRQMGKNTNMALSRQDDGKEIQKVSFSLVPSGGTYTLAQNAQISNSISWNSNAAAVQAACNANWTNQVTVSGNTTDGFTFTFNTPGPVGAISQNSNTLANGGNPVVLTFSTVKNGLAGITGIPIADGEVLFIEVPDTGSRTFSGIGAGDTNYQVVSLEDFENVDGNYWLAYVENGLLYLRNHGELEAGEETHISDPDKETILAMIEAAEARYNQDRNMKMIEGGVWSCEESSEAMVYDNTGLGITGGGSIGNYEVNTIVVPVSTTWIVPRVRTEIRNFAGFVGTWTIHIYGDLAGQPDETNIVATATLNANTVPGSFSLVEWTFGSPVSLPTGTYYIGFQDAEVPGIAQQKRGSGGGFVSNNGGVSFSSTNAFGMQVDADDGVTHVVLSEDAYIQIPGISQARNTISAQDIGLPAANSVAYISLLRDAGAPVVRPVMVTDDDDVILSDDVLVIARRVDGGVVVGSNSILLVSGQSSELYAQESIPTRNVIRSTDYLRSDDPVTWTGTQIQFTQNIILEQLNTRLGTTRTRSILVASSPITLNDGQILYVEIDRAAANSNVTPVVASAVPTVTSDEKEFIIIAKRIDVSGAGYLHLPLHKQVLNPGQTVRLGASGSGSSGDSAASAPIEGYQWRESDTFDALPASADSKVTLANYTNATFNIAKGLYKMSCDKSRTVATNSGTAITINLAPGFTVAVGDIVFVTSGARSGQWRRIATVNSQTSFVLDAAFTGGNASAADTLMISQAVWTKDLVNFGSASEKTRARDFFSGNITQIAMAYGDSITTDDDIANLADPATVVASASNQGLLAATGVPTSDTFGSNIFTRPTGATQLNNFIPATNADQERLHLAFFPSPTNGSVTTQANLLEYEVNFYADSSSLNSGVLDNAIGFSDASGTPYNCVISTPASLTRVALTWAYIPNVKTGSPHGQLEVTVDGKEIARFISSGVTPTADLYYTEVVDANGIYNTIQFTQDLSGVPLEITVKRRQGVIDSATQNTTDIALLKTGPTVQRFLSGSGTYTKPANVRWIRVRMAGGGGGGAGGGNAGSTAGGNGVASTFGTSLLTANGGTGGSPGITSGGPGGAVTVNSPATDFGSFVGGQGGGPGWMQNAAVFFGGSMGGANPFGGAGGGGSFQGAGGNFTGQPGATNTGAGGGGGAAGSSGATVEIAGSGGGAGGYIEAIILSPSTTYSYAIGTGGGAGSRAGEGTNGGAGAAGIIIVEEYY